METINTPMNRLKDELDRFNIDWRAWEDDPECKSIDYLFNEIQTGESELNIVSIDGKERPVRTIGVAKVDVFSVVEDTFHEIYEVKQETVKPNGLILERVRNLDTSIGEKLKNHENFSDAAVRGLNEELSDLWAQTMPGGVITQYSVQVNSLPWHRNKRLEELRDSKSFKGLTTMQKSAYFQVSITPDGFYPTKDMLFKESSGRENGDMVTSTFAWREHPTPTLDTAA